MKIHAFGTAWFSDFKLEAGIADETNNWNFLCLIFNYVDVNVEKNGTMKKDRKSVV